MCLTDSGESGRLQDAVKFGKVREGSTSGWVQSKTCKHFCILVVEKLETSEFAALMAWCSENRLAAVFWRFCVGSIPDL